MNIREQTELIEEETLCEFACKSADIGRARRVRLEEKCDLRTPFQRDRDRIIHSRAFRCLKHKTQVFLAPVGDNFRTRLTHTLEVSQIARTISRALKLNEDLTEAIALAHDLGHTPFGHAGEHALNEICPYGFKHYLQSVRIVDYIENCGKGLNLTYEVKNGIACHGSDKFAQTAEGNVVRLSDKIAYINHDIDDAVFANALDESDLPEFALSVLGHTKSRRISTMVQAVVRHGAKDIGMDDITKKAHDELREFLFENVYGSDKARQEDEKAMHIVKMLYKYYDVHPDKLPCEYLAIMKRFDKERAVCDFISGLSDQYAIDLFTELYIPKSWGRFR